MSRTKKKVEKKKTTDRKQRAEMLTDDLRNRLSTLSFSRSYTSLAYGIISLIVLFALGFAIFRLFTQNVTPEIAEEGLDTVQEEQADNKYTVLEGETLWSIAEKEYNNGYVWSEIAEANALTNPNNLEAGTELILPEQETLAQADNQPDTQATASPTMQVTTTPAPTVAQEQAQPVGEKITGEQYTVVEGDTLWSIAVRAYDDGYRWPEIAQVNSIENPHLIFVGTTLNLQR